MIKQLIDDTIADLQERRENLQKLQRDATGGNEFHSFRGRKDGLQEAINVVHETLRKGVKGRIVADSEKFTHTVEGMLVDCPHCDPDELGWQPSTNVRQNSKCYQCGAEFETVVVFEEQEEE